MTAAVETGTATIREPTAIGIIIYTKIKKCNSHFKATSF